MCFASALFVEFLDGSLPPGLEASLTDADKDAFVQLARGYACRFRGAGTLLQDPRLQATIKKMSTRVNWMLMPSGDLYTLVEADLACAHESLLGQRLVVAGALL